MFRISDFELRNFLFKLVLQMLARGFLDRAALVRNSSLFRESFLAGSRFDRAWQVSNFRPLCADFLLLGLGVGIHLAITNYRIRTGELRNSKSLDASGSGSLA